MPYVVSVAKFVKSSGLNAGKRRVAITYVSSGPSARIFAEEFDSGVMSDADIKDHTAKQVSVLEAEDRAFTGITEGLINPVAKPPPAVKPAEAGKRDYQLAIDELRRLTELVDLKVLGANDKVVTDAIANVKAKALLLPPVVPAGVL